MLHDTEPGCTDYVGGYPCDHTFWITSDNVPTCWTLGSFNYTIQMLRCETEVTLLGAFKLPNDGMRYEAYIGQSIIVGNPGDHHTILLPPNGSTNIICTNLPCKGHAFGKLPDGQPYSIQSDAWANDGKGIPRTGESVDVEGPQAIEAYLYGNMPLFLKLENDLEHRYNSSSYINTGSTWQLGQMMFILEVGGRGNTNDFNNMKNLLWSLQNPAGYLPNTYSGYNHPLSGRDPENQDAGLLPFCEICIDNIQNNFGVYGS